MTGYRPYEMPCGVDAAVRGLRDALRRDGFHGSVWMTFWGKGHVWLHSSPTPSETVFYYLDAPYVGDGWFEEVAEEGGGDAAVDAD